MSAKHGVAVLFGRRGRLIGLCMTLALAISGFALSSVAGAVTPPETKTYISLGDSISFGYTAEKFNVNFPNESPSYFEEGFTNGFNKDLNTTKAALGKGVVLVNLACPGETSNGLIGENEAIGGKTSTEPPGGEEGIQGPGDYHPCAYKNLDGFPLHSSLGEHSQLEQTLSILKEGHPAHPVHAITLNIGSNDELAGIARCEKEVEKEYIEIAKGEKTSSQYGGESPEETVVNCVGYQATHTIIPHILANIGDILGVIDSTSPGGGHYSGRIVLMGFYNPDSFVLPGSDALQAGVNQAIEENILPAFPNVTFANPFPVFNKFAFNEGNAPKEAKEQEAICKYTEMCNPNVQKAGGKPTGKDGDIHPTVAGYKELATLANKAWEKNPAAP